ncbi:MAG TPA: hypothetical protein GX702_04685, partial [Chloroflexi bacterium]|nr:hypothetical protein [Chloroflexota bacterium]
AWMRPGSATASWPAAEAPDVGAVIAVVDVTAATVVDGSFSPYCYKG